MFEVNVPMSGSATMSAIAQKATNAQGCLVMTSPSVLKWKPFYPSIDVKQDAVFLEPEG